MKLLDPESGYDLYADQYREDHKHLDSFDWEQCRELLFKHIGALATDSQERILLLDVGCGDGRVLKRLVRAVENGKLPQNLELHGWDISGEMLRVARKNCGPSVKFEKRDFLAQREEAAQAGEKNPGHGYRILTAFFVLVHVPEPRVFFEQTARLLRRDGVLICNSIPQRSAPVFRAKGGEFQIEYYDHDPERIEAAAETAGFNIEEHIGTGHSRIFALRKRS